MRKVLVTSLTLAMIGSASAHEVCGARKDIIEGLGKEYGETVRFEAIQEPGGAFLELLYSDKGGTFTILSTLPGNKTCVVSSGMGNILKRRDWAPSLDH